MYGANPVLDNGWWADDFHPEKNPTGCPPWVLGAVVASSCVNGMRHVLCHIREFRVALERNRCENSQQPIAAAAEPKKIAKKKKSAAGAEKASDASASAKAPRIFTVGGTLISFPTTFLSAVARVVFAGAQLPNNTAKSWKDLSDPEKDAFVIDCLLRNLKGLATFGNYASKAPNLPGWLKSYIAHFGAMFAAPEPDFDSISKLILGSRTLSQWYAAETSPRIAQSSPSEATPANADVAPSEIPKDVIALVRPAPEAARELEKPTRKRPKKHESEDDAEASTAKKRTKKAAVQPLPVLTPVEFMKQSIDWAKTGEFYLRSRRAFFDGGGVSYETLLFVNDTAQLRDRMDNSLRTMIAILAKLPADAAKV